MGACSLKCRYFDCKTYSKKKKEVWIVGGEDMKACILPPIFLSVLRLHHCFHRYQLSILRSIRLWTRNGWERKKSFTDVVKRTLEFDIFCFSSWSVWDNYWFKEKVWWLKKKTQTFSACCSRRFAFWRSWKSGSLICFAFARALKRSGNLLWHNLSMVFWQHKDDNFRSLFR